MVMYDRLKNFGKNYKNGYRPIIFNRRNFASFENQDNWCMLPQIGKSILRMAKIKNKFENVSEHFRMVL
jgi:hypothetical protein